LCLTRAKSHSAKLSKIQPFINAQAAIIPWVLIVFFNQKEKPDEKSSGFSF
jgi:hypothetical protein